MHRTTTWFLATVGAVCLGLFAVLALEVWAPEPEPEPEPLADAPVFPDPCTLDSVECP